VAWLTPGAKALEADRVLEEARSVGDIRESGDTGKADSSRSIPLPIEDDGKNKNTTTTCTENAIPKAASKQSRTLPRI
jgi:hypothetical protein